MPSSRTPLQLSILTDSIGWRWRTWDAEGRLDADGAAASRVEATARVIEARVRRLARLASPRSEAAGVVAIRRQPG